MRVDVDGDAPFLHALEQARLGLRRRAIDLVHQHHIREHRAGTKLETLLALVVDVDPDDVGGQQVRGALDARELAIDRARKRAGERRLTNAGVVLDQRVALGHQSDQEMTEDLRADVDGALDVECDAADDGRRGLTLLWRDRR